MYKLKKAGCIPVALLLGLSLVFSGCGSKSGEEASTQQTTTVQQSAATEGKADLEPVTLIWYFPQNAQKDQDKVFAAANEIVKESINATIDFKATDWSSYKDKMTVAMTANEPWDLCFTSWWFNNYQLNASKGAYLALDELLLNYAPTLYSNVPEQFWKATKINGKIYAMINYQIFARSAAIQYQKENLDAIGFDADSVGFKLENAEPYLKSIQEKYPDTIPINLSFKELYEYYAVEPLAANLAAISLTDDSLQVFNLYKSDIYKQHIQLCKKWKENKYTHGEELLGLKDTSGLVKAKKMPVAIGGTWKPGVEADASLNRGYPMVVKPLSEAYITTNAVTGTLQAVNRSSENPERAVMFMELMNTNVPLFNLIAYGIEGTHFKKLDDNTIETIPDSGYSPGTLYLYANQFNAYIMKGQSPDVWEETKKLNLSAKCSPALGFSVNQDPIVTEVSQCESVINEYRTAFDMGLLDIEKDYNAFIEKLDKAGAEKIVTEVQKQIDEWKKSN